MSRDILKCELGQERNLEISRRYSACSLARAFQEQTLQSYLSISCVGELPCKVWRGLINQGAYSPSRLYKPPSLSLLDGSSFIVLRLLLSSRSILPSSPLAPSSLQPAGVDRLCVDEGRS